jgi:hypothetical protein
VFIANVLLSIDVQPRFDPMCEQHLAEAPALLEEVRSYLDEHRP